MASAKRQSPRPKSTVHTLEIYWWEQDFCSSDDVELADMEPLLWNVYVEYSNGEV